MKNIKTAVALFALLALSVSAADGTQRKIVTFADGVSAADGNKAINAHGGVKIKDLDFIKAKVAIISDKDAAALKNEPGILSVEDDAVVNIQIADDKKVGAQRSGGGNTVSVLQQVLPWGIDKIDAELVWPSGNNADAIKVGVIDTGISSSHPDLKNNIKGGYNAINSRKSWNDDNGHGSHVAGIIAGLNNSQGVVGVAPQADLYAIKVLNAQGSGFMSDVIEGIGWAASNGMNVVNMSLGCACNTQALHDAVINAKTAGVIIVAAAGNDPSAPVIYPAAYPEVIAVGATDSANNIASFSSHGSEVDVSAPGVSIYSTYKGTGYATLSGTSMATPHVAGSIALLLNTTGQWNFEEVYAKLAASSQDLGASGWDEYFGYGLLNALSLVTQ